MQGYKFVFFISAQNIDCGYSSEPPRRGGSNEYPQSMFWAEIWKKYQSFFISKFSVFGGEISLYLNRRVFVMFDRVNTVYQFIKPFLNNKMPIFAAYGAYNVKLITKTCLYNFDPLKPQFYIHVVKLGFTGVYIIFVFLLKNVDCGYSLELPRRGGSNEYPQSMFWAEIWKNIRFFYLEIFSFWRWNFLYIWIGVFS